MARQNLLLVDDDAKSLRVMEVSLRNAGYAVTTAVDGAEALSKIETLKPALILADTRMPGIDGYELCRRVKSDAQLGDTLFIFLTEEKSVEAKVKGLELGADDYLSKPIYIKEVITRVRMVLQKRERENLEKRDKRRFFGSLEDMGVVDLLQTIEIGRKSGTIRFEHGNQRGTLWFIEGSVIDAKAGRLSHEEAIYRLLTWEVGTFEIDFRAPEVERVIETSTQGLLMEGMHRVDEWGRMCEQLPPLETVFQVDYAELAERLSELPDEVNALLRLFDGHRTAVQAIDDSEFADLEALSAISRLYFEGIIYQSGSRAPVPVPEPEPVRRTAPLEEWLSDSRTNMPAVPTHSEPGIKPMPAKLSKPPASAPAPAGPAGPERNLVDDLLRSAADQPAVEVPPSALIRPDSAPPAPLQPPPAQEEDEDDYLFAGNESVSEGSTEVGFFNTPVEGNEAFDDLSEPGSKAPVIVLAAFGVAVLGAIAWFMLQDTVEPREAPRGALSSSWHKSVLKKRERPGVQPPIKAEWKIPSEPEGPAPKPASESADAGVEPTEEAADAGAEAPSGEEGEGQAPPAPRAPAPTGDSKKDFDKLMKEGLSKHGSGRYEDAAKRFERALALAPADERALLAFAQSLLELNRQKDALKAARKVAKLNPSNARAHLIIGSVQQELGQAEASIEAYQRYLKLAPKGRYAEDVRKVLQSLQ